VRYHIERACRMRFAAPAREHHVQIRLTPWDDESQSLIRISLIVDPDVTPVARYDGFGNLSHHFAVLGAHRELAFSLVADVETRRENPFDFALVPPSRELAWIADSLRQAPRLWDFVLHQRELTPVLSEDLLGHSIPGFREGVPILQQVQDAFTWVQEIACFDPTLERSVPALLPALVRAARGTAADLSHLLIALIRHWHLPARFVSGYLDAAYLMPQPPHSGQDAKPSGILHHWTEVLIPGGGWRGFDPALGLLADAAYVRVAIGRDARDIAALRQSCKGDDRPELDETLTLARVN